MEIKEKLKNNKTASDRKRSWRWFFLFFTVFSILVGNFVGSKILKSKGFDNLWDFIATVSVNYKSSWNALPEKISIEIKEKEFKKLKAKRQKALERGVIINDLDGEYVDAILNYNGKNIDVKLRLKGHMTDHLQEDKWSFRVKIKEKDETFMGMKRFSIQHPGTRGYIYEWIYHELMKKEDVIALRYKFIDVNVNGENWGIYALEENFENELIENNGRLKAPILRYNPDLYWVKRYNGLQGSYSVDEFASYYSANPEAYREDKVLSDSLQKQYYLKAIALIEGLRSRKIKVKDAFDVIKMAKFHAIIDLVGGIHSIDWSDIKYYYNPVLGKLEPVAYESFTNLQSRELSSQYMYVCPDSGEYYKDWHSMIFSDPDFFKEYIHQLERVSKKEYLESFFSESNEDLKKNLAIINKEYPYKKFSEDDYFNRQKMIRKILDAPKSIHAYLKSAQDSILIVQIGSIDALPVSIASIEFNGMRYPATEQNIIPAKQKDQYVNYYEYTFKFDGKSAWSKDELDSLKINYSIPGSSNYKTIKVFPFPHTDNEYISEQMKAQISNLSDFPDDFVIDHTHKLIYLKKKNFVLNKDLVIPKGYTFSIFSGTKIDLKNGAKITSYSSFICQGAETDPIEITSSDSSSQGLVFVCSPVSYFKNTFFRGFAAVLDTQWQRTGAITFYESDAEFSGCHFYAFNSEDALNFIRSNFKISGCLFKDMKDDAVDADFSKGKINNTVFEFCKENAIDANFSFVTFSKGYIVGSRNKAINVKDGSELIVSDIKISKCYIAVSAEDYAKVDFKNINIGDCEFGLVAYKNKPSAGHATIKGGLLFISNTKENYLMEKKSKIIIDNKLINKEVDDVELIIKKSAKKK